MSRAAFVIASDRRERGNPVLLLENSGLDRHVPRIKCGVLAMTAGAAHGVLHRAVDRPSLN